MTKITIDGLGKPSSKIQGCQKRVERVGGRARRSLGGNSGDSLDKLKGSQTKLGGEVGKEEKRKKTQGGKQKRLPKGGNTNQEIRVKHAKRGRKKEVHGKKRGVGKSCEKKKLTKEREDEPISKKHCGCKESKPGRKKGVPLRRKLKVDS